MIKFVTLIIIFFLSTSVTFCQDWPDWRGSGRDAIWNESGIIKKFENTKLIEKWSVPIGAGYSGPTVSSGKVYVTDKQSEPKDTEGILCFDELSGKKLWEIRYDCEYSGIGYPAGPRASVVINEGKAYSLGTMGNLFCLDSENGDLLWKKDLDNEYDINMPTWGIASTPLVVDEKLVVQVSGSNNSCVVAFDKNTGKEIWRNLEDRAGYSAPIVIEKNGRKIIVNWTEHSLSGLNAETGKIYWRFFWHTGSGMSIATPVLYKDYIFVSAFYSGSLLIKLGLDYTTAEKVWQREGKNERNTDALHCVMNTPLIIDDYIYGVDSYGELRCLELRTGDRVWENQTAVNRKRWANIHFIQNRDITWMFNEQGELLITKLSPEGFNEISRAELIEPSFKQQPRGVAWSHPAFANKHVFARNDLELVCVDLSE